MFPEATMGPVVTVQFDDSAVVDVTQVDQALMKFRCLITQYHS